MVWINTSFGWRHRVGITNPWWNRTWLIKDLLVYLYMMGNRANEIDLVNGMSNITVTAMCGLPRKSIKIMLRSFKSKHELITVDVVDCWSTCTQADLHRWIGLTCNEDCDTEANWSWLDGAEYDYTNWDLNATTADIPPRDDEPCGVMIEGGVWHSQPCDDDTRKWKYACCRGVLGKLQS